MKAVAIVGMAEATRHLAPWESDIPVWVMNETGGTVGAKWLKRWDRSYQMHKAWDFSRSNNQNDPNHWAWLKEQTKPIFMQETHPEVSASVRYPREEIIERYLKNYRRDGDGGKTLDYWKSTAAYMLAHAGFEGYERIEIYGIEMSFETEYREQRPNFEFWCGIVGQTSEIVVPEMCGLLGGKKGVRYGYDQRPALNPTQFNIRLMGMQKEREKLLEQARKAKEDGEIAEKQAKAFSGDAVRAKALRQKAKEAELELEQLVAKINIVTGHVDEAKFTIETMGALNEALQADGQPG